MASALCVALQRFGGRQASRVLSSVPTVLSSSAPKPAAASAGVASVALGFPSLALPPSLPLLGALAWRQQRPFSSQGKEAFKQRDEPTKGTATQEGAEGARAAAEEAGYERAREDGERVRESDTLVGTMEGAKRMVQDAASGVSQMARKVADMSREAAGRGVETAKGLTGMQGEGKGMAEGGSTAEEGVSSMGQEAMDRASDAAGTAKGMGQQAMDRASDAAEKAQGMGQQAMERASDAAGKAQDMGKDAMDRAAKTARDAGQGLSHMAGGGSQQAPSSTLRGGQATSEEVSGASDMKGTGVEGLGRDREDSKSGTAQTSSSSYASSSDASGAPPRGSLGGEEREPSGSAGSSGLGPHASQEVITAADLKDQTDARAGSYGAAMPNTSSPGGYPATVNTGTAAQDPGEKSGPGGYTAYKG